MKNPELDRLKAIQQSLFERKQEAFAHYVSIRDEVSRIHDVMEAAWEERSRAREVMNREFNARRIAYEHHDAIWENYRSIRDRNNYQIEYLKREADREHEAMKECFDRASDAYQYGDKSAAPAYAADGHQHKDARDSLNAEVSALIQEIKEAKEYAERHAPRVDSSAFDHAKAEFDRAKAHHEAVQAEFKRLKMERDRAKANFDQLQSEFKRAQEAFRNKLEELKRAEAAERELKIQNALGGLSLPEGKHYGTFDGKPAVILVTDATNSGQVQIFYGGAGTPDGPGHHHVNVIKGELRFWREHGVTIYQNDRHTQINNL